MHGQNRSEYKSRIRNSQLSNIIANRAKQYRNISKLLIQRREFSTTHSRSYHKETLQILQTVLIINPDSSYFWNYRREILVYLNKYSTSHFKENVYCMKKERDLVIKCLHKNSKGYSIWFHWKWCLRHWLFYDLKKIFESEKREAKCIKSPIDILEVTAEWSSLLDGELDLCEELLILDERNFHCWNYRRFVVSTISTLIAIKRIIVHSDNVNMIEQLVQHLDGSWHWIQQSSSHQLDINYSIFVNTLNDNLITLNESYHIGAQISTKGIRNDIILLNPKFYYKLLADSEINSLLVVEWNFSHQKVQQNFSNYSALHYRSKLLPLVQNIVISCKTTTQQKNNLRFRLVQAEFELLTSAIFTEPDDQSPWWYHNFLVGWIRPSTLSIHDNLEVWKFYEEILEQQLQSVRMLVQGEKGRCKWGLLALIDLINARVKIWKLQQHNKNHTHGEDVYWWKCKSKDYIETLITIDPDRKERYTYILGQIL